MLRMKFRLDLDCESAAFNSPDDDAMVEYHTYFREKETARILRKLADDITTGHNMLNSTRSLFDVNGNRVGSAVFREEEV